MLHGLASSPSEFGLLRHPMRRAEVSLETLELDAYSYGRLGEGRPSWRHWLREATAQVEAISQARHEPIWIGGLCSGALIAAGVAISRPDLVRGLIMLSPLVSYDGWGLPPWYRLRYLAYALGLTALFEMKERFPFGVKCERMRAWLIRQVNDAALSAAGPASVNLTLVREAERLSRFVKGQLHQLRRPTCIVHALDDEICRWSSVQDFASRIVAVRPALTCLEDSYHMITLDRERDTVARRVADFVLAGAPVSDDRQACLRSRA